MNRLQFWNLNKVAASFVCATGMLLSTAALAGDGGGYGGYDDGYGYGGGYHGGYNYTVQIHDLEVKRDYDGDIRLWGELYGRTYNDRIEAQVAAVVRVEDRCINPGGKVVYSKSSTHTLTLWDYARVGPINGYVDFDVILDIDRRLGYSHHCPNYNWHADRRVWVENVHLRLLNDYGYGYGYDRNYDIYQGYDCGGGYHGGYGYDVGYGYGYGYGYDNGWYGYGNIDHGWGYGYGYYDQGYGIGGGHGYGYGSGYGHGGGHYDYGYYDGYGVGGGAYDHDHGYVVAMADCYFRGYYSRYAYCNYH